MRASPLNPLLFGLALGLTTSACALDGTESAPSDTPSELASVVVPDPDFTFETRAVVKVRLEPDEVSVFTPVEVFDSEGRLLFKGVVQQPLELGLRMPSGAAPTLTVVSGRGPNASRQYLTVADGQVVAKL